MPSSKYDIGDTVKLTNGTIATVIAVRVHVTKEGSQESYFFQCGASLMRFEISDVQCKVKVHDTVPAQ